jgi:dephospho-CoA kinase
MPIHIVITAKIGSGKTTLSKLLELSLQKKPLNVLNLDYDQLTHEILAQKYNLHSQKDRRNFAQKFFSSPQEKVAFEQEIHPLTYHIAKEKVAQASQNHLDIVIHQIPLLWKTYALFEKQFQTAPQIIVRCLAPTEEIKKRLQCREMSQSDIERRLTFQLEEDLLYQETVKLPLSRGTILIHVGPEAKTTG